MDSGSLRIPGNVFHRFKHRVTDTDLQALLQAGCECLTISDISVPYNNITSEGGKALAAALRGGLSTVISLDLSFNAIEGDAVVELAEALTDNHSVSQLRLAGNPLGTSCGSALYAMLSANSSLTHLDLYSTDLDMKALVLISHSLRENKGLRSLNLGKPLLPEPDDVNFVVQHLVTGLRDNTSLVDLTLSYFNMYDHHIKTLLPALCASNVTSLSLKANKLAQDAGTYLGRLLERKQTFRVLDIGYNRIGDVGMIAISQSMKSHSALHTLMLQNNGIGDDGIRALIDGVKGCRPLRVLEVWGNEMQRTNVIHCLYSIKDLLESLEHVDFQLYMTDDEPAIHQV